MKKVEPYSVISSTFKGSDKRENYELFTYEITFNRSLGHTGKFTGIADGLNEYERKERRENVGESLADFWYCLKKWFINLF